MTTIDIKAPGRYLPSAFDVDGLAVDVVSSVLLAAADLAETVGIPPPEPALDARHVACAFGSERHLQRAGAKLAAPFAPLSRFARTADGWIRLHATYPHHERALLSALSSNQAGALAAIQQWETAKLEEAIVAAGGAAAAVRSPEAWLRHPQGRAATELPLVDRRQIAAGRPRWHGAASTPLLPAAGLRVLDLTRVIAGPVGTRMLASLGADVLRIDPPQMPELDLAILDTCPGKRLAALDLRHASDAAAFEALLENADVLVHGYRPGALAALGLDDEGVVARHPHLIVVSVSAWGHKGPWNGRRGFDSLVQAACGIAAVQGAGRVPGALPVQALDHATGYLLAAAVLREVAARQRGADAARIRLALAGTAAALMRRPARGDINGDGIDCGEVRLTVGDISMIGPPGTLNGRALGWSHPPRLSRAQWTA